MVALRLWSVWEFQFIFPGVSDIGLLSKETSFSRTWAIHQQNSNHARVQLLGGPLALVSLRISVHFSRCQWHRLIQMKKQAFLGHELFTSRLQSMGEYSYMVALRLWSVWEFQFIFPGVSDIGWLSKETSFSSTWAIHQQNSNHAWVQLHCGPSALVNLRISVHFSRS